MILNSEPGENPGLNHIVGEGTPDAAAAALEGRIIVCLPGRMGDIAAAEPLFLRLKELYPGRRLIWYTRSSYTDILKYSPAVDEIKIIGREEDFIAAENEFNESDLIFRINFKPRSVRNESESDGDGEFIPLLRRFCRQAGIEELNEAPQFHFGPEEEEIKLPDRYVVFHCMAGGKSRLWTAEKFRQLAEHAMEKGLAVVEIGLVPVLKLRNESYFDFTSEHKIQNVARIIRGAEFFVGVESGFGHIANALGKFALFITGRLRQYPKYNAWSGDYGREQNCSMLRFYGGNAAEIPVEMAEFAMDAFLAGKPLTGAECRDYCRIEQIKRFRKNIFYRFCRFLTYPWKMLSEALEYHRRHG